MAPGPLAAGPHDQQRTVFEHNFVNREVFAPAMLQQKAPCTAEADRRNNGIRTEFFFIVAVPPYTVSP